MRHWITILLMIFGAFLANADESRTEISFEFRVKSTSVDSIYGDNAAQLQKMKAFLNNVQQDSTVDITAVSFCGAASPEGSSALNRSLSWERLIAVEKIVKNEITLPDSIISRNDSYIPWEYLKSQIATSDIDRKDEILAILNSDSTHVEYRRGATIDSRSLKLQSLDAGRVWDELNAHFFSSMRYAYAIFETHKRPQTYKQPQPTAIEPKAIVEQDSSIVEKLVPIVSETKQQTLHLYLKTNAIGWIMGVSNLALELDLSEHWSASLPIYWSSWNYFKHTLKYRTFTLQPEVRYWFSNDNTGWFTGVHFGIGWFNIATDGNFRIQDHDGNSPALGGGISGGFRLPISHNKRWMMEFTLGVGIYRTHYDKFINQRDGLLSSTHKKTWVGIDQAAISLVYTFNLNKAKGAQR